MGSPSRTPTPELLCRPGSSAEAAPPRRACRGRSLRLIGTPFQPWRTAFARRRLSRRGARSRMLPCRELRRAPFIYLGRLFLAHGTLFLEQALLALESPAITPRPTVRSYHAMTRHYDGDPVVGARARNRAHGFRRSDRRGDFRV